MTRSKRRQRETPPAIKVVNIKRHPRKIAPALPAAIPRVRAKKGKR
ncbi:MAG: hypothetical protein ACLP4W_22460 [Mycobacterium sp.]